MIRPPSIGRTTSTRLYILADLATAGLLDEEEDAQVSIQMRNVICAFEEDDLKDWISS